MGIVVTEVQTAARFSGRMPMTSFPSSTSVDACSTTSIPSETNPCFCRCATSAGCRVTIKSYLMIRLLSYATLSSPRERSARRAWKDPYPWVNPRAKDPDVTVRGTSERPNNRKRHRSVSARCWGKLNKMFWYISLNLEKSRAVVATKHSVLNCVNNSAYSRVMVLKILFFFVLINVYNIGVVAFID